MRDRNHEVFGSHGIRNPEYSGHMHEGSLSECTECTGVGVHQKLVPDIAEPQMHEDSETESTGVAVHHMPVPDTAQPHMHEESESASSWLDKHPAARA